jgi:hypothetical protein
MEKMKDEIRTFQDRKLIIAAANLGKQATPTVFLSFNEATLKLIREDPMRSSSSSWYVVRSSFKLFASLSYASSHLSPSQVSFL